jgi:hypothetical protein
MYDFELPDGVTFAAFRSHPVTQTIREAAYGGKRGLPSKAELDALHLSPPLRARVREACESVAAIHDRGDQQVAWNAGDKEAASLLERLPAEQRDPRFYRPAPADDGVTHPTALAALIPRF